MSVRIGTPRCLLVVAPHPDDETIGAHALIARLRRRGTQIRVVVVTDGAGSHRGSTAWPTARLVRERQRESRRAMRRIGVPAGKVCFLGLPDGALHTVALAARRRIVAAIRAAPKPLLVLAPAESDHHADHRVCAASVAAASRAGTRHLAYPVWPAGIPLRGQRALPLTAQERLAKRHAIRGYRTQAGRISDDPAGFAMTRHQIAAFSRPSETFVEHRR